jgi:hypothetical protein
MSVKLHYLHSHLEIFGPNLGDVSEEHGECFHQDIEVSVKRYQGRWDAAMMVITSGVWLMLMSRLKRKSTFAVHF